MIGLERIVGRLVAWNNDRIRLADDGRENPRDVTDVPWHETMVDAHAVIRAEWDAFERAGGRLPLIEEVIQEHQGNEGPWRAGLLVHRGRPCEPLASVFPRTVQTLGAVAGLRSALWSLMEPGTELPEHCGPNAGVLRYHLGVRCVGDTAVQVGDVVVPYREGEGVLFDDTVPHAAWNRGPAVRVTLFCELERPLPPTLAVPNRWLQGLIALDPRYRSARARAAEWHHALNG